MKYVIDGNNLPVLKVTLDAGESIECESGGMSWMDPCISMQTKADGLGKMLGKMLTKESAFTNIYSASATGEIAFSSKFPGSIQAVEISPNKGLIIQKGAYLASVGNITSEVFVQKKLSKGLFGGEGFLMRKYSGSGTVFLEIDGSAHTYTLAAGESKIIDTGYLAAMSDTCKLEIQAVKGVTNALFGGEGFFNTVVSGPGEVIVQSMPIAATAMTLYSYMPTSGS